MAKVKTFAIKLCDGWTLNYDGEKQDFEHLSDIFKEFGWDTEHDPNAKECADIIWRELYCFGYIDLSKMCNGKHTCTITVIPCKDTKDALISEEETDNEEV